MGKMLLPQQEYLVHRHNCANFISEISGTRLCRRHPTLKEELFTRADGGLMANNRVELLGLWGGSKSCNPSSNVAGAPELKSLSYLASVRSSLVKKHGIPVVISILFADSHHLVANGRHQNTIDQYHGSLAPIALEFDMSILRLSTLWDANINAVADVRRLLDCRAADAICQSNEIVARASKAARKHSHLMTTGVTDIDVAWFYIATEVAFLREVDKALSHLPIFFAFSDPVVQSPIAQAAGVPMLHFYSTHSKEKTTPWTQPNERAEIPPPKFSAT